MLFLDAAEIEARVPMANAIEHLRQAFAQPHHHLERIIAPVPGGDGDRLCLLMPAFDRAGRGMVKLSTVFPDNRRKGLPTIQGVIVVFSASGEPVAVLDGRAVTRLRTAAASALAASYLACQNSAELLIVGTGDLAPSMALAHCTVRPIRRVTVWGRAPRSASDTVAHIRALLGNDIELRVATALPGAVAVADIVSCATSTAEPLVCGNWLKPGAFLDLVGSFSPVRREADDDAILRSSVFVDTWSGALAEAGDLLDPIARGVISKDHIRGDLSDLVRCQVVGRRNDTETTLFKSVGAALEDLAIAQLAIEGERHA